MKLITKAIEDHTPPLYAFEAEKPEHIPVTAKLFDPMGRFTFYMTEYDPEDRRAFGWVVSPLGPDCDELGYVSIAELEELSGAHWIERDMYFTESMTLATAMTASQ